MNGAHRVLLALTFVGPMIVMAPSPSVHAQCSFRTAESTGDATYEGVKHPRVSTLRADSTQRFLFLNDAWLLDGYDSSSGWKRLFSGGSCPTPAGQTSHWDNVDCASRRLLNAAHLMYEVDFFDENYTWKDWVSLKLDGPDRLNLSLDPEFCSKNKPGKYTPCCTPNGGEKLTLSSIAIFDNTLIERAAVVAHEARHFEGPLHCEDSHACPLLQSDPSWAADGAYRREVEFLEQALRTYGLPIPPAARADAVEAANILLADKFYVHPGFVFDAIAEFGYDVARVNWSLATGATEVEIFRGPDELMLATFRIEAASQFSQTTFPTVPPITLTTRDMTSIKLCGQLIRASRGRNVEFIRTLCPEKLLNIEGTILTSLKVGSNDNGIGQIYPVINAISIGGRSSPTQLDRLVVFGGSLRDSILPAQSLIESVGSGTLDASAFATSGHFITGAGFAVNDSTGNVQSTAIAESLGPQFETRAGANGGSHHLLECNATQVPIGLRLRDVLMSNGARLISYFGLICADPVRITCFSSTCEDNSANRRISRPSFVDPATGIFHAAVTARLASQEVWPGALDFVCPVGQMIRGVRLRAGAYVDRVEDIRCSGGSAVTVNIGGTGGWVSTQDCWYPEGPTYAPTHRTYAPYIYARAGNWLDSLAVGCIDAYDFREDFDSQKSVDWQMHGVLGQNTWEHQGVLPGSPGGVTCLPPPAGGALDCAVSPTAPTANVLAIPHLDLRALRGQSLRISFFWYYRGITSGFAPPMNLRFKFDDETFGPYLWSRTAGFSDDAWVFESFPVTLPLRGTPPDGEVVSLQFTVGPSSQLGWTAAFDALHIESEW